MKFNEALAKLAATKADGFITRAGGPTVRNAVGIAEQALHRYVSGDPVEGFDASKEDLDATDWTLGSFAAKAKAFEGQAKAEADAKAKAEQAKAEADAKTKPTK